MKLKELVHSYSWKDLNNAITRLYPNNEGNLEGSELAFETLKQKEAIDSTIQIRLYKWTDNWFEEEEPQEKSEEKENSCICVDCIDPNDKEKAYSLAYYPWDKLLGMDIFLDDGLKIPDIEILAHCLWEVTFYGYTEEQIKSLFDGMEKYDDTYYTSTHLSKRTPEELKEAVENVIAHLLKYKSIDNLTVQDLYYLQNAQNIREITIYPFKEDWITDFITYFKQEFYEEADNVFDDMPFKECTFFSLFIIHSNHIKIEQGELNRLSNEFVLLFPNTPLRLYVGATNEDHVGLGDNGEEVEITVLGSK